MVPITLVCSLLDPNLKELNSTNAPGYTKLALVLNMDSKTSLGWTATDEWSVEPWYWEVEAKFQNQLLALRRYPMERLEKVRSGDLVRITWNTSPNQLVLVHQILLQTYGLDIFEKISPLDSWFRSLEYTERQDLLLQLREHDTNPTLLKLLGALEQTHLSIALNACPVKEVSPTSWERLAGVDDTIVPV